MPNITFQLNGEPVSAADTPDRSLLFVIRELGFKGTRSGCLEGYCGCCTVLVDNHPVQSCDFRLSQAQGRCVNTVEGLAAGDALSALQKAFVEVQAAQCGYCVSGILMTATSLLMRNKNPTRLDIAKALERHLCRCGAHDRIIRAIELAAETVGNGATTQPGPAGLA